MKSFPKRNQGDNSRWQRGAAPGRKKAAETAWEDQAEWYDDRHGAKGDDFHADLVIPAVLRQLDARAGDTILDLLRIGRSRSPPRRDRCAGRRYRRQPLAHRCRDQSRRR